MKTSSLICCCCCFFVFPIDKYSANCSVSLDKREVEIKINNRVNCNMVICLLPLSSFNYIKRCV